MNDEPIDLRIGSPTLPPPQAASAALAAGAWPVGYPPAAGLPVFVEAVQRWAGRILGLPISSDQVVPVAGAKEAVGTLAWLLGLGPGQGVALPELAYPTYAEGAAAVGARVHRYRDPADLAWLCAEERVDLVWAASPANPTSRVLPVADLMAIHAAVSDASRRGRRAVTLVFDETYVEIADGEHSEDGRAPSGYALAARREPAGQEQVMGLYSVSKRDSLAALRVGYVITDPVTAQGLISRRRALGLLTSAPGMAAAAAVLDEETMPARVRARHRRNRERLLPALTAAGFTDAGGIGMFLWLACPGADEQAAVAALAGRGVLVTAGTAFGPAGAGFIRVALTAAEDDIAAAAERLGSGRPA